VAIYPQNGREGDSSKGLVPHDNAMEHATRSRKSAYGLLRRGRDPRRVGIGWGSNTPPEPIAWRSQVFGSRPKRTDALLRAMRSMGRLGAASRARSRK